MTQEFKHKDAILAFSNMRERYEELVLGSANAFMARLSKAPKDCFEIIYELNNIHKQSVYSYMEAVAYLCFTRGHSCRYVIAFEQTTEDSDIDKQIGAEDCRKFTAKIKAVIIPKEYRPVIGVQPEKVKVPEEKVPEEIENKE
jgi:hypothetical protein